MKWTDHQQDAISARRGTMLVAAAAGSGKTAVLVQRAIERLTDREDPVSADRLLIVTFTKAAAAEMRARLERRLHELLRETPSDPLLQRQSLLLSQAHIGTVDGFCSEMLREFFHLLDLSPDYKILSEQQEKELTSAALNETLEQAYAQGTASLLADAFGGDRDDRRLMETVLSLYRFMQSHPFPEQWLRSMADLYSLGDASRWQDAIFAYAAETAEHCAALCARGAKEAETGGVVGAAFYDALLADRERMLQLCDLAKQRDWDAAAEFVAKFSRTKRGILKKEEKNELSDRLDALREQVKDAMEDLKKYLCGTAENCVAELRAAGPLVDRLCRLTLDFLARYAEKKREKNFLDYSDLEHFAIELFLTPEGERTQTALEVGARFDEIMIDEYQDINEVQDSLFRALSRDGENLFMVGDVKQSIYGFRRAMPEIFLRCRRSFAKYDRDREAYPATLTLDRNFRSRQEVTDTVNFVFSRLMSEAAGDVDYTGEERLVCGAEYPPAAGNETELVFLSRPVDVSAEAAESAWIAKRIKELVDGGFKLYKNGELTPARYGDFCILLRSANKYAPLYAQELIARGVPARSAVTGGFFSAAEIGVIVSLLQIIDNPNQDIPLLAVLMSPIYGFSAEDCARLRVEDRKISVYLSLCRAAEENADCARVLKSLEELRSLAAAMPSDVFLTTLYERTGYPDMVLAMENGTDRLQNLRLLQSYAREYEGSGYHGVSGFVRFLERLKRTGGDLQAAELSPDSRNAVSIMSIHKSKGLEFPVCIVAGCGRNFASDHREDVLLHPELGLGVKLRDAARSARFTTTAREAISLENARADVAEELRVLYVAMTRAKEKLLLVASDTHMDRTLSHMALELSEDGVSPYTVRKAKSAAQWLMLCALCHPDGGGLREIAGAGDLPVFSEDRTPWKITLEEVQPQPEEEPAAQAETTESCPVDEELLERLQTAAEYRYPYAAALGIPAKVAASKLAAEQGGQRQVSLSRPAWMGEKGMTPAQRGTALHEFMRFAQFDVAAHDPQAELTRLVRDAFLTGEQAEAVDLKRVAAFLNGPLGQRIQRAEVVYREKRFTAVIPASLAEPERPDTGEESVILQGAVDCAFEEDGRLTIVDFKTDRVGDPEELSAHYAPQLRLYAAAMREITGKEIGELLLYSFWLNETVKIST